VRRQPRRRTPPCQPCPEQGVASNLSVTEPLSVHVPPPRGSTRGRDAASACPSAVEAAADVPPRKPQRPRLGPAPRGVSPSGARASTCPWGRSGRLPKRAAAGAAGFCGSADNQGGAPGAGSRRAKRGRRASDAGGMHQYHPPTVRVLKVSPPSAQYGLSGSTSSCPCRSRRAAICRIAPSSAT
jgi:hypothetical protein